MKKKYSSPILIQATIKAIGFRLALFLSLLLGSWSGFAQIAAVNTQTAQVAGTTLIITKPTGLQVGDLMIVNINTENVNGDPTSPAGWTKRYGYNLATNKRWAYIATKVALASDVSATNYTFTRPSADYMAGAITAFRGVDISVNSGVEVLGTSFDANNANPIVPASITTLSANSTVVFLAQLQDVSGSFTTNGWRLGGVSGTLMTQLYNLNPTASNLCGVGAAMLNRPIAGATGSGYQTASDGRRGGVLLVLKGTTPTAAITTPNGNITIASGTNQSFVSTGTANAPATSISNYSWNFGDGSPIVEGASLTATSRVLSNFTLSNVVRIVTLTVTDNLGNTATAARNITVQPGNQCTEGAIFGTKTTNDYDGDGINNVCDQDDDNDGILDTEECNSGPPTLSQATAFASVDGNSVSFSINPLTNQIVADITRLDNSLNLTFNGNPITNQEIQYQASAGAIQNIRFLDGTNFEAGGISAIWVVGGAGTNPDTPLIKIIINSNGVVEFYGSKVFNGPLFPMELFGGAVVNSYVFNTASVNNFVIDQNIIGATFINGRVSGGFIQQISTDTDGDGAINCLDLDSDNDGCSDSNEYYGNTTNAANGQQFGQTGGAVATVNAQGRVIAASYTSTTAANVLVATTAAVTVQPSNQTALNGTNISFIVAATSTNTSQFGASVPFAPNYNSGTTNASNLRYQWEVSTNSGSTWGALSNAGVYSGVTSNTLTITGVSIALKNNQYRTIVTVINNVCTRLTSNAGILNVPDFLDAVAENFTATGAQAVAGATSVGNVLANDTYNGGAAGSATISNVAITVTTPASSINGGPVPALNTTTGVVSIPAGTPAGTYTITYQLCDLATGTPCDTASTEIIVAFPAIAAVAETSTITADGGTIPTLLTNDTFNGGSATTSNVTITTGGTTWPIGITLNPDGTVTVTSGTPVGSNTVSYQICDILNPANCSTVSTTINVSTAVNAVAENFTATGAQAVAGATSVGNVLANDTYNGGAAGSATISNVAITVTTPASSINGGPVPALNTTTGVVSIPAGTPAGTYTITYQLCDLATGTPCDTASTEIIVAFPAINALADSVTATANGGTTYSVLANDTYNGGIAGSATETNVNVTQEGSWPAGITLNSNGTIAVGTGTAPSSYSLDYKICDALNPTNCHTATATVVVTATVNAVMDQFTTTGNEALEGVATIGNVLANDHFNSGTPGVTASDVTISVATPAQTVVPGAPVPLLDTATGIVLIPVGTPAGLYSTTYQICATADGMLCSSANVNITISGATICYGSAIWDQNAGATLNTMTGISSLAREGVVSTWPTVRKSGWVVLEAKTKGFVLNRVSFNASNQPVAEDGTTLVITSPVEGMMVFDTTNNCLKVHTTTDGINFAWFCMETQACPE